MLVGIDASRSVADRPTGIETYSRQLIKALLDQQSPHQFRLYFRSRPPEGLFIGAQMRTIPFPRLWTHVRLAWEMAQAPPEMLFVPSHVVPPIHPRRTLVTVHDLGYLFFPEAHPWQQRTYLDLSTRWNVRAASHVLADSQATKTDLIDHYRIDPDRITVAYPGKDESLEPVDDPTVVQVVKATYDIEGDYFLFLGTLHPRKNLSRLVEAFKQFRSSDPESGVQLVLAGKSGWLCEDLVNQIRELDLGDCIKLPGYVAAEDKAALLSGAIGFLFPSLHEGFGLPVLEAQACGCPVITSTDSSLPEVAGDAALLVDPRDVHAIAGAMRRVVDDHDLQADLRERGLINVQRFSWESCARTVLHAMGTVLC